MFFHVQYYYSVHLKLAKRKDSEFCHFSKWNYVLLRLADSMMIPESKVSESCFGISFRDQNNKQNIKNVGKYGHRFLPTCFYLQYFTNFHLIYFFVCASIKGWTIHCSRYFKWGLPPLRHLKRLNNIKNLPMRSFSLIYCVIE